MNNVGFIFLLICLLSINISDAKKIKHSFKIEKELKNSLHKHSDIKGREIILEDEENHAGDTIKNPTITSLKQMKFSGYEKESNSNKESFILTNPTHETITGFKVKIDYTDLQGRMLHSRIIEESCNIPGGESRKFDIPSWDTQHTYFYYLGNEPKKVATPFKVKFNPISFWIDYN